MDDADRSSIAFLRTDGEGRGVVCACNFTPVPWELRAALPAPGTLSKILCSDDAAFGGTGALPEGWVVASEHEPFLGHPHSALLKLPPLSCTFYSYQKELPKERPVVPKRLETI